MNTFLFVLGILFLTVVCPIWIVFHYITRWKQMKSVSREDEAMLGEVWEAAQRMESRIESLERILDTDQPSWRRQQAAREEVS